MHKHAKYIMVDDGLLVYPIMFPHTISHANMALLINHGDIISAGFFYIEGKKVIAFGNSVSLDIDSVPIDGKIIKKALDLG